MKTFSKPIALCALFAFTAGTVLACGPWFPNTILMGGDATLLLAPISNFRAELRRIKVTESPFRAFVPTNGLPGQTAEADLADFRRSLDKMDPSESAMRLEEYQSVRRILEQHAEATDRWRSQQSFRGPNEPLEPAPILAGVSVPKGLSGEFADYLEGSIEFHAGETNAARAAWERLLARASRERHYRSTWAAFMLGKSWMGDDPEKAAAYFEKTRDLARSGYADSLGLGASSYGWQAKTELDRGNDAAAIRLYLVQSQTGDPTAVLSLRIVARKILSLPEGEIENLAKDGVVQQVVTAYIVSHGSLTDIASADETTALIRLWLSVVESAGIQQIESADRLALAAYQRGLFEITEHWLAQANARSALAQWLRAKMSLRAGKIEQAAQFLSQVVRQLPHEGDWANPPIEGGDSLDQGTAWETESPVRQSMGELAALHLTRRAYYEALDTFLRSGYWSDAAYVAEYVLSPDELAAYVDRQWPPENGGMRGGLESRHYALEGTVRPDALAIELRYLTGRRLARLARWNEAVDFYPTKWKEQFQKFVRAIECGRDQSKGERERAAALWEAAQIARQDGMELFGTEVEPDWHLLEGEFDWTHLSDLRSKSPDETGLVTLTNGTGLFSSVESTKMTIAPSSTDEQRRLMEHKTKPDHRFHYRYYAADLAWEAAQLMPNNSDETARVLWRAGSWLKARDPQFADRFYKALVRRCRTTELGNEADRLRWFPRSDRPSTSEGETVPEVSEP